MRNPSRYVSQGRGLRQKYYEKKREAGRGEAICVGKTKQKKETKIKDKVMFPGSNFEFCHSFDQSFVFR